MQQDKAETIAIQALGWLAADQDLFQTFLGASGMNVNDLKEMAADPQFLGAVLDFILMTDSTVTGFCDSAGLGYDMPIDARHSLPGGEMVNWT